MGWASFLEDKVERLNTDLNKIRNTWKPRIDHKRNQSASDAERHLSALIRVCETFLRDINKHLEIATDPQLDMADQLLGLRKENALLNERGKVLDDTQTRLAQAVERSNQLQKDFDRANGRAGKNYAQLEEMTRRYKHLEKEHLRLKRTRGVH